MKVASGSVLDRPWGLTLGAVGMRKIDAQITLTGEDGKTYAVAFKAGQVAAATSPLPNDSVTRVALTSHFVSPSQVKEITQRLASDKDGDEVDVLADAGRLTPEHVATLRRRLTIQRAARTFAIDRATFEIEDELTLRTLPGFSVPLGAVIFQGVRMNLSEQRLVEDLRELGSSFILRPTTTDQDLASYGFDGDIRSVIVALRKGTTIAELELASHRDIEPRTLHAMIYALVCGMHCDAAGGQAVDRSAPPASRTSTNRGNPSSSHATIKVDQPLITRTRSTLAPATRPTSPTSPPADQPPIPRTLTPSGDTFVRRSAATTTPPAGIPRTGTPTNAPTASRTATPTSVPVTMPRAPSQPPTAERPRPVSHPPLNTPRANTLPGTFTGRTSTGTVPPRTVTPTAQPPLRSATMPPRTATPTSSPLDEFIKETTTSRGFSAGSTGPYPILDEFKGEPTTSRGINALGNIPPAAPRTITTPRTITERDRSKKEIEALIETRLAKLEAGADYFAILGLPFEAPLDAVRNNYVETSRRLHPDSLAQVGIADDDRAAQRVLAQVNAAFNVLTDAHKRRDYINAVRRGDPTPIAPRARTGDLDKTELAAEAFQAGEVALKREDIPRAVEELGRAVALAPTNHEYMAMFAWAQFCAANDKQKIYIETRKTLEKAIHRGEKPVTARFYLGRVERMIGHDREAMNHFQEVLLDEPNHREAASEVRVLEQKLARGTKPKR